LTRRYPPEHGTDAVDRVHALLRELEGIERK
jgi:hypothetical protein